VARGHTTDLVDVRRLDAKVTDIKGTICAECKSLDRLAGAGVNEIVFSQEGLESTEEGLELGSTIWRYADEMMLG
jgi:hypothetical protein